MMSNDIVYHLVFLIITFLMIEFCELYRALKFDIGLKSMKCDLSENMIAAFVITGINSIAKFITFGVLGM